MYLWRRLAAPHWLIANEELLRSRVGDQLAIIERTGQKRALLEVACRSREQARDLIKEFGGRIKRLSRDWLERLSEEKHKPLRIGKRLIIMRGKEKREAGSSGCRLVLPAGMAFGTGEHATTAMSLRLLEQVTRGWKPSWSTVDLGTGSGILALTARYFGAQRVVAVDVDPIAVATAKENARLNKIDNLDFQLADVRRWNFPRMIDIITANLFSELLIDVLPKLKRSRWLILSGALREQEKELVRALRRNKIDIVKVRRRGKWIAILARGRGDLRARRRINSKSRAPRRGIPT
jgi:ribosomal protein L11 methyltransferase